MGIEIIIFEIFVSRIARGFQTKKFGIETKLEVWNLAIARPFVKQMNLVWILGKGWIVEIWKRVR